MHGQILNKILTFSFHTIQVTENCTSDKIEIKCLCCTFRLFSVIAQVLGFYLYFWFVRPMGMKCSDRLIETERWSWIFCTGNDNWLKLKHTAQPCDTCARALTRSLGRIILVRLRIEIVYGHLDGNSPPHSYITKLISNTQTDRFSHVRPGKACNGINLCGSYE